jgi:hypothetical protein
MDTLDFDFFMRQLIAGMNIDETCFYFLNDPKEEEHFCGFSPQFDKPYYVGLCDIENGIDFTSADELVNAPIFNGQSLKSRWSDVKIVSIMGLRLEDWFECCKHV